MKSISLYQLKVKLKLVDTESKYFRYAERKYKTNEKLREHFHCCRVKDTRSKARHLHLAYGYLRGLPYNKLEHQPRTMPNVYILSEIVREHTGLNTDLGDPTMVFTGKGFDQNVLDNVVGWIKGAEEYAHLQS